MFVMGGARNRDDSPTDDATGGPRTRTKRNVQTPSELPLGPLKKTHLLHPERRRAPLPARRPALHDRVVILRPRDGVGVPRAPLVDHALQQPLHGHGALPPASPDLAPPVDLVRPRGHERGGVAHLHGRERARIGVAYVVRQSSQEGALGAGGQSGRYVRAGGESARVEEGEDGGGGRAGGGEAERPSRTTMGGEGVGVGRREGRWAHAGGEAAAAALGF